MVQHSGVSLSGPWKAFSFAYFVFETTTETAMIKISRYDPSMIKIRAYGVTYDRFCRQPQPRSHIPGLA